MCCKLQTLFCVSLSLRCSVIKSRNTIDLHSCKIQLEPASELSWSLAGLTGCGGLWNFVFRPKKLISSAFMMRSFSAGRMGGKKTHIWELQVVAGVNGFSHSATCNYGSNDMTWRWHEEKRQTGYKPSYWCTRLFEFGQIITDKKHSSVCVNMHIGTYRCSCADGCVRVHLYANPRLVRYALIITFLQPRLIRAACDLYTLALGFECG